jgi:spermidine synthase
MMATMPARIATYRRALVALSVTFVASLLLGSAVLKTGTLSESLGGLLFSPFFAPAVGGAFVIHAWAEPRSKRLALAAAVGTVVAIAHALLGRVLHADASAFLSIVFGLGLGSLAVVSIEAFRSQGDQHTQMLSVLLPSAVLPAFVLVSNFFLAMTALLHPMVLDASVYAVDVLFGRQPSFAMGRLFNAAPWLEAACRVVYWNLPLALAFVYGARRRHDPERGDDVLWSFVAVGLVGFLLYHLLPVVGPAFFFVRDFPVEPPELPDPRHAHFVPIPVPRNCVPSLHTAWALILYWQSRNVPRWVRWGAAVWLVLTVLGTLGFGFHYAMDLVIAAPFTVAIIALFAKSQGPSGWRRRTVIAFGASLTAAWLVALRFFPVGELGANVARWLVAALTVLGSFALERRLGAGAEPSSSGPRPQRPELALTSVVLVAGFSAMAGEFALGASLAPILGGTLADATTRSVGYVAGLALGSALGGELGERRTDPLRIFALCQVGVAIYEAAALWLAPSLGSSRLALLLVLPPSALTGLALPLLARPFGVARTGGAFGVPLAAGMLGAAFGALFTRYTVLPFLGVTGTTWVAVLGSLLAGLAALRISATCGAADTGETAMRSPDEVARTGESLALVVLALASVVGFAIATVHVHLLANVAGNTPYAFALMTTALALGVGLGAAFARRFFRARQVTLLHPALLALSMAAAVLASAHGWNATPTYFASFAGYPLARTFESRELVRFVVCSLFLIPAAFSFGALVTTSIDIVARSASAKVRATGRAACLALGAGITGVIGTGFILIPRFGSLASLDAIAAVALAAGMVALARLPQPGRRQLLGAVAVVVALFVARPKALDYGLLTDGSHMYFRYSSHGRIVSYDESLGGGIAAVGESRSTAGASILALVSNGRLQGDGLAERKAQVDYATYPLLHTLARERALVIDVGTGVSIAALVASGFQHVDVAETSAGNALLADSYFGEVTGRALRHPAVELHLAEGRQVLRGTPARYDLISVGALRSSITTGLCSRDFYALAKSKLSSRGVIEQSVQLHHLAVEEVASTLATARSEFAHVWLYVSGSQGVMVACDGGCEPSRENLAAIDGASGARAALSPAQSAARLVADLWLAPEGVDRFLADLAARGLASDQLVSTDDNLLLESAAPRGSVLDYQSSLESNEALLRVYARASALDGTRLTDEDLLAQPPETERQPFLRPGLTQGPRHGKTEP